MAANGLEFDDWGLFVLDSRSTCETLEGGGGAAGEGTGTG